MGPRIAPEETTEERSAAAEQRYMEELDPAENKEQILRQLDRDRAAAVVPFQEIPEFTARYQARVRDANDPYLDDDEAYNRYVTIVEQNKFEKNYSKFGRVFAPTPTLDDAARARYVARYEEWMEDSRL